MLLMHDNICVKEFLQEVTPNATDAKLLGLLQLYCKTLQLCSMYCCPGVFQFIFYKNVQALTEKGMQKEMQYPSRTPVESIRPKENKDNG